MNGTPNSMGKLTEVGPWPPGRGYNDAPSKKAEVFPSGTVT
jgi:hypothetical protein